MNDTRHRTMAEQVDADLQEAVDAMKDAATIGLLRNKMNDWQHRELLIQAAEREVELLAHQGHEDLSIQLQRVVDGLRTLQPKVVVRAQGAMPTP